jgi:phage RecT family recombinase
MLSAEEAKAKQAAESKKKAAQQSMGDVPDFVKEAAQEQPQEQPQEPEDRDEPVDIGEPEVPQQTPQDKSQAVTKALMRDKAYDHFLQSAQDIVNVTSRIDSTEGRRLVFMALNRIEVMMQEQKITWKQVNQRKLISALANTALLGLDAEQGEVYPIPYKENGQVTVNLQRGYKGERKIRLLHSINKDVEYIDAFLVRKGDTFSVKHTPETDTYFFEEADAFGNGEVVGAFGYVQYKGGRLKVHKLTKADLDKRRQASKSPNSPAWAKWTDEMYLAKTIMATCKDVPVHFTDDVMQRAYISTDFEEVPEVEITDEGSQKIPLKNQGGRYVIGAAKQE